VKREVGKITKAYMGFEPDHGTFGFYLMFDFGGTGQGYGPFVLAMHTDVLNGERSAHNWTDKQLAHSMRKMVELYEFLQVEDFSKAVGRYIEVERDGEEDSWGEYIIALHRLPVDGAAKFTMKDMG
jgi:hypothetical protein